MDFKHGTLITNKSPHQTSSNSRSIHYASRHAQAYFVAHFPFPTVPLQFVSHAMLAAALTVPEYFVGCQGRLVLIVLKCGNLKLLQRAWTVQGLLDL